MVYTIRYKVGDTAPLSYRIDEWNADEKTYEDFDLSGKTVYFSMIKDGAADWSIRKKLCRIVSSKEGLVEYDFATGETDTTGMYRMLFTIVNSAGKEATFPEYDTQWMLIFDDRVV